MSIRDLMTCHQPLPCDTPVLAARCGDDDQSRTDGNLLGNGWGFNEWATLALILCTDIIAALIHHQQ